MSGIANLVVAPIVLPLLAGAGMLLLNGERHRNIVAAVNVAATVALVCVAVILLGMSDSGHPGIREVYAWAIGLLRSELSSFSIGSPRSCCS